jgi:hypothetical protein
VRRRIILVLDPPEATALLDLAQREDRDPRRQASRILREGLIRAGTLAASPLPSSPPIPVAQETRP